MGFSTCIGQNKASIQPFTPPPPIPAPFHLGQGLRQVSTRHREVVRVGLTPGCVGGRLPQRFDRSTDAVEPVAATVQSINAEQHPETNMDEEKLGGIMHNRRGRLRQFSGKLRSYYDRALYGTWTAVRSSGLLMSCEVVLYCHDNLRRAFEGRNCSRTLERIAHCLARNVYVQVLARRGVVDCSRQAMLLYGTMSTGSFL